MSDQRENNEDQPLDPENLAGEPAEDVAKPGGGQPRQDDREDLLQRLQRLSADYLNYQKRAQREAEQVREYANADLVKQMIGVVDDMDRALESARINHGEEDPLYTGMLLVHDKLLEVLNRAGLEVINALGQKFNPQEHSALGQQPSEKIKPNTVVAEPLKGYRFKGRLLRPAGVIIAVRPTAEDEQEE